MSDPRKIRVFPLIFPNPFYTSYFPQRGGFPDFTTQIPTGVSSVEEEEYEREHLRKKERYNAGTYTLEEAAKKLALQHKREEKRKTLLATYLSQEEQQRFNDRSINPLEPSQPILKIAAEPLGGYVQREVKEKSPAAAADAQSQELAAARAQWAEKFLEEHGRQPTQEEIENAVPDTASAANLDDGRDDMTDDFDEISSEDAHKDNPAETEEEAPDDPKEIAGIVKKVYRVACTILQHILRNNIDRTRTGRKTTMTSNELLKHIARNITLVINTLKKKNIVKFLEEIYNEGEHEQSFEEYFDNCAESPGLYKLYETEIRSKNKVPREYDEKVIELFRTPIRDSLERYLTQGDRTPFVTFNI